MTDGTVKQGEETRRGAEGLIESLLLQIDQAPSRGVDSDPRKPERFPYRRKCRALIQQPGDATPVPHIVYPSNLGEEGMSLLHFGFVHVNSTCCVQLVRLRGSWLDTLGIVIDCRFVAHSVHEVEIRFQEKIEPSDFCKNTRRLRVLLVDDDPAIAQLGKVLLERLNVEVDYVDDGHHAVDKAATNRYDLILMDLEMPQMDGLAATRELRRRGYFGRIVAGTAFTQPADREKCAEAGFDDFLAKPFLEENLSSMLESMQEAPILSAFAEDPAMATLINSFVERLAKRIPEIEQAVATQDKEKLQATTRGLKAEGASYGFEVISRSAEKIETALLGDATIADVSAGVDQLIKLCLRIRSTVRSGGSGNASPSASADVRG